MSWAAHGLQAVTQTQEKSQTHHLQPRAILWGHRAQGWAPVTISQGLHMF